MRSILLICASVILHGCAQSSTYSSTPSPASVEKNNPSVVINTEQKPAAYQCAGNAELPAQLVGQFIEVKDEALLKQALGEPEKGALCVGKVYQSTEPVTVYRAWNSTNANSQKGQWWAASTPKGKVATYREDYEICYQWSPLDVMSQCTLDTGSKVVIGTGQSAKCSDYLQYDVSAKKQIFVPNATESVAACEVFDGEFSWKKRGE